MKNLLFIALFTIIHFSLIAQDNSETIGRPYLSKNEIGIQIGNNSGVGNGILLSFNRYMSEQHILHFSFSPVFALSKRGLMGTFEFWNENRMFMGKTGNAFFSHGLEVNFGDRNRNFMNNPGDSEKSTFAAGIGYNLGFGHIINDRLTFTMTLKPRYNYLRTSDSGISHSFKHELNLAVGVNYRFK